MGYKPRCRDHILNPLERNELKQAVKTFKEQLVIWTLLYTGMRVSEFIHMRKDWINDECIDIPTSMKCDCDYCKNSYLNKKHTMVRKPSGMWMPKTQNGSRTIFVNNELKPIIEQFFNNYDRIIDYVKTRKEAWEIIKKVSKRTSIKKDIFPHSLRSTFATALSESTQNPMEVKDTMGWADLDVANSYIKTSREKAKQIGKKIKI